MSSRRVLVVDDHPVNLKLATAVLESANFEVLQAEHAEMALLVMQTTLPELILMDIALPGMDGLTLTRQLKAAPETRHIPIIALTAFAMKGDEQKARDAGCDGYITKPVDTRRLAGQLESMLSARNKL